jgi:hypothetical protein
MTPATPIGQPKATAEIERLGFGHALVSQYDLGNLSPTRRVQVRETKNYAPRESVERFAVQMAHSAFPPIIVTSDGWIVDGNTRAGACEVRKEKFYPALVLDATWENASQKQQDEIFALAATLNCDNGVGLTPKETRQAVRVFINLGWLNEQIGRSIGVKTSKITMVRREIDAEHKLGKVGINANGDLKGASLRALGSASALTLNDMPYRALAELAADAGLNAGEITAFAKEGKQTASDQGALSHFADLRAELADRIKERELTGVGKPPLSRQLRQHLGFVAKFAGGREQELIETNPAVGAQHILAIETAAAVLAAVLEMQRPR